MLARLSPFREEHLGMAVAVPLLGALGQFAQLRLAHRHNRVARAEVTRDLILRNALADNRLAFQRHRPEGRFSIRAVMLAHLEHSAAVAIDELPAVAPRSAPANPLALDHDHLVPALGQFQCRRHAGKPRTDHADVAGLLAQQPRPARCGVGRRCIVAGEASVRRRGGEVVDSAVSH